jgi:hypothetical protein
MEGPRMDSRSSTFSGSTFSGPRGRLWATGKTKQAPEDPLKAAEEAMGHVFQIQAQQALANY